jgi:hypothetical protein
MGGGGVGVGAGASREGPWDVHVPPHEWWMRVDAPRVESATLGSGPVQCCWGTCSLSRVLGPVTACNRQARAALAPQHRRQRREGAVFASATAQGLWGSPAASLTPVAMHAAGRAHLQRQASSRLPLLASSTARRATRSARRSELLPEGPNDRKALQQAEMHARLRASSLARTSDSTTSGPSVSTMATPSSGASAGRGRRGEASMGAARPAASEQEKWAKENG